VGDCKGGKSNGDGAKRAIARRLDQFTK
jgi:hypothetical protein